MCVRAAVGFFKKTVDWMSACLVGRSVGCSRSECINVYANVLIDHTYGVKWFAFGQLETSFITGLLLCLHLYHRCRLARKNFHHFPFTFNWIRIECKLHTILRYRTESKYVLGFESYNWHIFYHLISFEHILFSYVLYLSAMRTFLLHPQSFGCTFNMGFPLFCMLNLVLFRNCKCE